MPSLKETTINASFFPGAGGEQDHVEDVARTAIRTGKRDLSDHPAPSPPSTGPSSVSDVGGKAHQVRILSVGKVGRNVGSRTPQSTPLTRLSGPPFLQFAGDEKVYKGDKILILHFEEGDPEDPLNWPKSRKWVVTFLLCMMTTLIGLSTSAYSNTISGMAKEFGVAEVVGQVGMFTGRREVYLTAYGLFVITFLFLSLGKNIGTEIVGRLFSGLFGCCGTILVGGTLGELSFHSPTSGTPATERFPCLALPSAQFSVLSRWIEWVHMIANGVLFIAEVFFLKETRGAKILSVRAKQLRKETGNNNIKSPAELETESIKELLTKSSTKAIKLMIHEPVVLAFGFWIAMAWGITFLFLSVIPLTFAGNHHWSEGNAGLPYLALILGCFIGFGTGMWADRKYDQVREENSGVPIPEYRLWGAMCFSWMLPIGLFIFSFTQFHFVHWIAPMISLVLIILGIYHIFLATYNYTSDAYGEISSSLQAIAGQSFMRNGFAASFPLFATFMFKGMGYQYAGLLLALITSLCAPLPFVLFRWGASIRAKSKYAVAEGEVPNVNDEEKLNDRPAIAPEAVQTSGLV
ncbi:hypothetical protein P7C70_g7950, partial [Phenoliferia sp. Uapishka_3]